IWVRRLRILIAPFQVRVRGCRGQIVLQLLHILAMISLRPRQSEEAFLQNRIAFIPQRQREAQSPLPIADSQQPILAPAIGAAAGLIVCEEIPARAVFRIVLAHRAPLPLSEVRTPALPVGRPGMRGGETLL